MSVFTRSVPALLVGATTGLLANDLYKNVLEGESFSLLPWHYLYEGRPSSDGRSPEGFRLYSPAQMKQHYRDYFGDWAVRLAGEGEAPKKYPPSAVQAQQEEEEVSPRRGIPDSLMGRFLAYAKEEKETGTKVLFLDDFIACLFLLPTRNGSGEKVLDGFPSHVQARIKNFFKYIDMDNSNSINYAEFVVLFTMLSTQKRTFDTAFQMFDAEGDKKVSKREFCRLLNTLMVDPAVQVVMAEEGADGASIASLSGLSRRAERGRKLLEDHKLESTVSSEFIQDFVCSDSVEHESPPPGSSHRIGKEKKDKAKLYAHLRQVASSDKKDNTISYDLIRYKMDFLRWELRALEFGIFDKENKGVISLNDFRRILNCDISGGRHPSLSSSGGTSGNAPLYKRLFNFGRMVSHEELRQSQQGAVTNESPTDYLAAPVDPNAPVVNWQFYQSVFEIIKESDRTLSALQLALKAEPPVEENDLQQGAVPDNTRKEEKAVNNSLLKETTSKENSRGEKMEARKSFQRRQRPTALTWSQFQQVLHSVSGLPALTDGEQALFFELFDADRSGTITPSEFGQLCELKRSFFATYLPRFDEPKRNTIQQFFYCMQQLE
ncbi:EF-hand domain pair/EF hand, putative [Angomonas deanei]|uniref:EF-hand domain pair/EF hand, putative n=1 Tax=Angomonas deanei TaxID=59799 RepID=A0A7G2CHG3_9TRYP|nr:EF-hand domain pair/EF hand, putative [Angomonas deanei]